MFNAHRRQDQKTIVANQTVQVGSASPLCPSNIPIPVLQGPRCRTEGQGPKISMPRTLHHISDLGTAQRSASQIVVSIKKSKPDLGFLRIPADDRRNADFAQLAQRATEFSNIRLNRIDRRALKAINLLLSRQIQNTTLIQFGQRFPATHLLQSATWRPPIQPFANPSRQMEPRNRGLCSDSLLNPIQDGLRKMLTTNIHVPPITSSTPCVKCVQRLPPPRGRVREGGCIYVLNGRRRRLRDQK